MAARSRSANDPADQASLWQIRSHLREIAVAFKHGDFGKPLATHSEFPPGVPVMQRLKDTISYTYAETPGAGIVRMATTNAEALGAILQFLKANLKPGGRLAIVDFRKDAPQGPPVEFRFTPDQISAELAQAGFRLQARHDFLPQQVFLAYGLK